MTYYEINFDSVNFEFYLNKSSNTKEMCKHENFFRKQIEYFWPMRNFFFNYDVSYSSQVCPYTFLNSHLINFGLSTITNSLIFKNRLEFMDKDEDIGFEDLNISQLKYPKSSIQNLVLMLQKG